jgi:UDP-N-acetylmuramoyl-tripeptide--D-alanyl-D-alanine ligase
METLYIKDLVRALDGKFTSTTSDFPITGISIDSRTIKKGEIYFAIQGSRYNGHDFIREAVDKGASAVVYSEDKTSFAKLLPCFPSIKTDNTLTALGKLAKLYMSKFNSIKTVGITGSNGKTTTKEILASIFNKKGKTLSNRGNFNNRIGLPLSIFNLDSEIEYAVFEMGTSLHGEIRILSDIVNPVSGIITNIGYSHLKTFTSPKGVFEEKKVLFENIKEDGIVVVNKDDNFLKTVCEAKSRKTVTFACNADADVRAKNIELSCGKTSFELFYRNASIKIVMPAKGKFNILNALAAATCAIGFGFSLSEIKYGIESFIPPKKRMETLITNSGTTLINDAYNANPSSVKEAIQTVAESYSGKEINLVLGDMLELGDKSAYYHCEIGKFISDQKNINSI